MHEDPGHTSEIIEFEKTSSQRDIAVSTDGSRMPNMCKYNHTPSLIPLCTSSLIPAFKRLAAFLQSSGCKLA
jgi:hypothetical protein